MPTSLEPPPRWGFHPPLQRLRLHRLGGGPLCRWHAEAPGILRRWPVDHLPEPLPGRHPGQSSRSWTTCAASCAPTTPMARCFPKRSTTMAGWSPRTIMRSGRVRYEEERHKTEPYFLKMNLYAQDGTPSAPSSSRTRSVSSSASVNSTRTDRSVRMDWWPHDPSGWTVSG